MIISISGPAGSGKSTLARMLAEKLGWQKYYIGGIRRDRAAELGLTLAEYNKKGESDPMTDREVDEYQSKLGQTKDDFIIEGRTSWYFIPHSFKIFVDVGEREGAQRIFKDLQVSSQERNEDKSLTDVEAVYASVKKRRQSDTTRYKKYYGIDVYDTDNYDFVLDSSGKSIEDCWEMLWLEVQKRLEK